MIPGIYQGAAAMTALERWQTSIAGNLASGSTTGFKRDETTFSAALAGGLRPKAGDPANSEAFMPEASSRMSDAQGSLRSTGKSLDFAVQGPGYFQVRTADGATAYTRNGEFHLDAQGKLVNNQGFEVQSDAGPVTADLKQGPITVDRAGQISQGSTSIGKLPVFDLAKAGELRRSGDGLVAPADGGTPGRVANPDIQQGYVEESNVQPLQEMVNLITVSRAYEVSQKLITSLDQTTGKAIESLGNS